MSSKNFENRCNLENRLEIIDRYLSGELNEQETRSFEEHYFECDHCFKELRLKEGLKQTFLPGRQPSDDKDKKRSSKWPYLIPLAAAILIVIFVGVRSFFNIAETDKSEFITENEQVSPHLENLVDQFQRSQAIGVLSPDIGSYVEDKIEFHWQDQFNQDLYLKILNNRDKLLYTIKPEHNGYIFDNSDQKLPSGLNYWKLETEDKLLYVGKFYVIRKNSGK